MQNQKAKDDAVSKDPKAAQADAFTQKLTGNSKLTAEVYALAADVFSNVVKDAKGDPAKMKEALEKFARDPASFADKWTPEQKAKLKALSEKLPQPILGAPSN